MKTLILTLVLLLTTSCNKSDDENGFDPHTITPILIGKGDLFIPYNNNNNQQYIVITNTADWNNFTTILSNSGNPSAILSDPSVNFNLFQIIAVFDNVKPTGGNTIDITNVIENTNNILIIIQRLKSGDTTIPTQPFHIVKIPKSTKPVVFQ